MNQPKPARPVILPHPALPRGPSAEDTLRAANAAAQAIRVLVVDDHPVVRKGLRACLGRHRHVIVVGEAADGHEALRLAREVFPDLVLMDLDMPRMNGLTATELLRKQQPGVKVLILSMHGEPEFVRRILQTGAQGYVLKQAPVEELLKAIETVHSGGLYFSEEVARIALNKFVRGEGEGEQASLVSNREREVLIAIASGLSNKEIASRLGVGVRTVETHRERIMRKLDIHTVAGLTRFAIQNGLVSLQEIPRRASP